MNRKMLIKRANFVIGGVIVAMGFKLISILNNWVFMPSFPNLIDFFALVSIGAFLMAQYVIK